MSDSPTEMETLTSMINDISGHTYDVGSWLWVDILQINNPHSFYVRPRNYSKHLPFLQIRGETPEASDIRVGDIYVFQSDLLKCDVRGRIVSFVNNGDDVICKMFAIDIGCFEDGIPLKSIWKTCYPVPVPPLATHCQLADCTPRGDEWDDEAIDALKKYVEGERAKMIVRSKTPEFLFVELYNSCPDDIATLLALTDYSSFGYVGNAVNRFDCGAQGNLQFYAPRDLEAGAVERVRMQSGSLLDEFYVTPTEEYPLYLQDRNNYTGEARSQPELVLDNLKLDAPIGVYYHRNNKYERALVKEIMPEFNRAKLQLVDWGIFIEESIIKMKSVPRWYMRVPARAIWCTLDSSQSFAKKAASSSFPGTEYIMTVKTLGGEDNQRPHIVLMTPVNY